MFSRIVLIITFAVIAACHSVTATASEYIVITNSDTPIESIKRNTLRKIWLQKNKYLYDGQEAVVVGSAQDPARKEFVDRVIRKSPGALNSYWSRLMFTGKGAPPPLLSREEDIVSFVGKTSGAIAYVSKDTQLSSGVKRVTLL